MQPLQPRRSHQFCLMGLAVLFVLPPVAALVPASQPRGGPQLPAIMRLVVMCCPMLALFLPVVLLALCLVVWAVLLMMVHVAAAAPAKPV